MEVVQIVDDMIIIWFQELGHMVVTGDVPGIVIWLMGGGFVAFVLVAIARLTRDALSASLRALRIPTRHRAANSPRAMVAAD